jgi:hypothetical protein
MGALKNPPRGTSGNVPLYFGDRTEWREVKANFGGFIVPKGFDKLDISRRWRLENLGPFCGPKGQKSLTLGLPHKR